MAKDGTGRIESHQRERHLNEMLSAQELSIALATRNELATERRSKHSAIIDIIKAVVVASTSLFIAMRFNLPPAVVAMLPFIGIAIAVVSMLIIRVFRKDLRRIEWKGCNIEERFQEVGIEMTTTLFTRPDSVELKFFTVPMMVHLVLISFWIVMFFIA